MAKFLGTWKAESSENLENWMREFNVHYLFLKIIPYCNPEMTVTNEGDKWKIFMDAVFRTVVLEFVEGEPVKDDYMDGRKIESIFKFEGDSKLVQKMDFIGSDDFQMIIREITPDGKLKQTMEYKGVTASRTYKKVS